MRLAHCITYTITDNLTNSVAHTIAHELTALDARRESVLKTLFGEQSIWIILRQMNR